MLHCSQPLFFASSETKHIFEGHQEQCYKGKKMFCFFKDLQLQEKRTFLQDMKKLNSRSTADISYVKEKWLAFTSHLKAIFFSALKYAIQKY